MDDNQPNQNGDSLQPSPLPAPQMTQIPPIKKPSRFRLRKLSNRALGVSLLILLLVASTGLNAYGYSRYRKQAGDLHNSNEALRNAQNDLNATPGTGSPAEQFDAAYIGLSDEELNAKRATRLKKLDEIIKLKFADQDTKLVRYPCDKYEYPDNGPLEGASQPIITEQDGFSVQVNYDRIVALDTKKSVDKNKVYPTPLTVKKLSETEKAVALSIINGGADFSQLANIEECGGQSEELEYQFVADVSETTYPGFESSRVVILADKYKNETGNSRYSVYTLAVKGDDFVFGRQDLASTSIYSLVCAEQPNNANCASSTLFPVQISPLSQLARTTVQVQFDQFKVL